MMVDMGSCRVVWRGLGQVGVRLRGVGAGCWKEKDIVRYKHCESTFFKVMIKGNNFL